MALLNHTPISVQRKRAAMVVAALTDLVQIAGWWAFLWGGLSVADDFLDFLVAVILLIIVGPRWRIALALVAELIPGLALFPTWTAFIWSLPATNLARVPPVQPDGQPPTPAAPQIVSRVPPRLPDTDQP